jgi:serine/arginine repetitive matrix protein 2
MLGAFSRSSSPDPLNDSPTFQSPTRRQSSVPRRSFTPQMDSPTKRTFQLDLPQMYSPQKLRVTVEAGSDTENAYSLYEDDGDMSSASRTSPSRTPQPVSHRRERIITTTVPLKGLSDSEGPTTPKRGRGRPRKSGTPIPPRTLPHKITPTKNTTPNKNSPKKTTPYKNTPNKTTPTRSRLTPNKARRRRKSIGEQVYGDSEIDEDFKPGRNIDGRRQRRRKSRQSGALDDVMSSGRSTGRGRRKTLPRDEVEIHEDVNDAEMGQPESPSKFIGALSPLDSNAPYSPSKYSAARSDSSAAAEELDMVAEDQRSSQTPEHIGSSPRAESSHTSPTQHKDNYPSPSSLEKPDYVREEVPDASEEVPEFDTIIESEEFSMISVDSVPSLRQHISPELVHNRAQSISIGNQSTLTADESTAGLEASIVQDDAPEQKTSPLMPQNRNLRVLQDAEMEDSFSSIPSEILEAATPGRNLPPVAPETHQDGGSYDDSFSAIPSVILDAATPAPLRQTLLKSRNASQASIAQDKLQPSVKTASSAMRRAPGSVAPRLLTPSETPSPNMSSSLLSTASLKSQNIMPNRAATEPPPENQSYVGSQSRSTLGNESYISTQMKSSPPPAVPQIQTDISRARSEPRSYLGETQTPSIMYSSPTLPPLVQITKQDPFSGSKPSQGPKPLSPAARAGRMLQDLMVPSSPRGPSESLGSPFKSPILARKSLGEARGTNPSPLGQMAPPPRPSSERNLFRPQSHDGQFGGSVHDDPFVNSAPLSGQSESYDWQSGQHQLSDPRLSNLRSEGNSYQSEDDMSWQAEEVVLVSPEITSDNRIDNSAGNNAPQEHAGGSLEATTWEDRWAAERAAVSQEIEAANSSKVIVIDSDSVDQAADAGDDEGFDLLLETLNSPAHQAQESPEPDRFGKARSLSPRNINNKRSMYSDELSHLSSPMPDGLTLTGNVINTGVDRDDLSGSTRTRTFNFQPRVRARNSQDVFALLAASPNRLPPVLSRNSEPPSMPAESSPVRASSMPASSVAANRQQQQFFRPIPQKQDFTPRMRDPESSFGSSPVRQPTYGIFGAQLGKDRLSASSAASRPFRASSHETSTPPPPDRRVPSVQLSSPAEIHVSTPPPQEQRIPSVLLSSPVATSTSTPPPRQDRVPSVLLSSPAPISEYTPSIDEDEARATERTEQWTESVRLASAHMQGFSSPTKSCLRSPLKTPTGLPGSGSSSKTVAFVSSSPLPSSPVEQRLSSSKWSRDHWLLLDAILQTWKPENQEGLEQPRRRNSTRVISKLLGKIVHSGNDRMKLQQWHLEVVDEFRGSVPGWKEETIAMRVFALIIGERDRALGLVDTDAESL